MEWHLEHAPRAQDRGKGEQLGTAAVLGKREGIAAVQPDPFSSLHQPHIQIKPCQGFGGRG